jgi:hypothetical protein
MSALRSLTERFNPTHDGRADFRGYSRGMARGWESKGVEEQIGAAEAARAARERRHLTPGEVEVETRRDGLVLARARIARDLEAAHDPRYRAMLERALAHLDAELASL